MSQPLPTPETCAAITEAVLANPLDPGAEAEAHMQICRACSEARVAYLAQEEAPEPLAPAGYYDRLPERVLRKLPARPRLHQRLRPFTWAAAAALLVAVGASSFWAGRANRAPLVEANLKPASEAQELVTETPFQDHEDADNEDAVTQLTALSDEDANAVIRTLANQAAHPAVAP
ncbi:hypothetical protein GETHLI_24960 [Geothrix limicola]|uniref:Zinc-finger domain-containing protein n=1 Tax=Geothrix limicola TaxID=2927978 RepID=A0ABQ5QIZ2_9BACT|nr:hypothetical protein [Geothrix limicola]GLH73994.1 hypothetical protein GETHLI_24960 [Geothrix limicola]